MSRRGSLLSAAAAIAVAFTLLAWVSGAGSLEVLQSPTSAASPAQLPQLSPQPGRAPTRTPGPTHAPSLSPGASNHSGVIVVLYLLALALVLVALTGLALLTRWAWRVRWHRPTQPPDIPFDVLPEVSRAVAADAQGQLATLQGGSPRNAIVACWLRLESATEQAGVPPHPAETSSEFTARVLGALAVDPAMFKGFAGLYREARFSRHEMGEPARRSALAALRSLHDDIAESGIPIPPQVGGQEVR
jgi:hypothetical protein